MIFKKKHFSNIIFLPAVHVSMKKKTKERFLLTFGKKLKFQFLKTIQSEKKVGIDVLD